jgi:hypothetical protein
MRCFRGLCWVSGVCSRVSGSGGGCSCWTYAFGRLDVLLYYAAHALVLGAHVGADAVELDRVLQAHLALGVHPAFLDEALAQLRAQRFDLCQLVSISPCRAVAAYMFEALRVGILGEGCRVRPAGELRDGRGESTSCTC